MKAKIQTFIGLIIIGAFVFGIGRSVYNHFTKETLVVTTDTHSGELVKDALFWYEESLEHTAFNVGYLLKAQELSFIKPMYDNLAAIGVVDEYIKTMSEEATEKLIELDAYRGSEPNVWEIALQEGYSYIFKITIVEARKRYNDLTKVKYLCRLYKVSEQSIIWEATFDQTAGFLFKKLKPEIDDFYPKLEQKLIEDKIFE